MEQLTLMAPAIGLELLSNISFKQKEALATECCFFGLAGFVQDILQEILRAH